MSVYQRKNSKSRHWFYKFTINGVTYKKAIPTARTRRQADEAERRARQDVHDGTYGILPDVLFSKFVTESYLPYAEKHRKNVHQLKSNVEMLSRYFGRYTLRQISPLLIEKFKIQHLNTRTVRGNERKASSVNAMLVILSGILTRAIHEGRLKDNPCRRVKHLPTEETKLRTLSVDEEKRLLGCAATRQKYIKPILQLALWLGWRENEIIHLRKCDVDFAHNLVFVPHAKWAKDPRKTKGVPMSQAVRELLSDLVLQSESEYLFCNPKTKKPYSDSMVRLVFKASCEQAGITELHFHCLRHTFGTRLAEMNVGVDKIQRAMGHSSITTTMIYVHTSNESLQRVMETAISASSENAESSAKIVPLKKRKVS